MKQIKLLTLLAALVCAGSMWAQAFDPYTTPLTVEAKVTKVAIYVDNWAPNPIYYSINGGALQTIAGRNGNTVTQHEIYIDNVGDKVEFWSDNNTHEFNDAGTNIFIPFVNPNNNPHKSRYDLYHYSWSDNWQEDEAYYGVPVAYVYGNVMSLLSKDNFATMTELPFDPVYHSYTGHFKSLFAGMGGTEDLNCIDLSSTKDLVLPATTVGYMSYTSMFEYSTISRAPILPSAAVDIACYTGMFYACRQLMSITCFAIRPFHYTAPGESLEYDYTNDWTSWVSSSGGVFTGTREADWESRDHGQDTGHGDGIPTNWTTFNQIDVLSEDAASAYAYDNDFWTNRPNIPLYVLRTLYKDGAFNTICLPFDVTDIASSPLAGAEVFAFSHAEVEEEAGEKQLRQVISPVSSILAGVPYLIRWANTGEVLRILQFPNNTAITATTASTVGTDVQFIGFFTPTHIDDDANHSRLFLGENNTLYWPETGDETSMKGFRAYFNVPTSGGSGAPMRRGMPAKLVIRENAPTGVESIQDSEVSSQKVLRDGQLIIIRNGVEYNANGSIIK